MKNLKVGQSFEVVEVLIPRGFEKDFIIGKYCLGVFDANRPHGLMCKSNAHNYTDGFDYYLSGFGEEYKLIGKLTITKLK